MKPIVLISVLASLGVLAPAFAQDASPNNAGSPSRAQIEQQARDAEQSGQLMRGEASEGVRDNTKSVKARADVKNEARTAEAAIKQPRTEFGAGSHDPLKSTANRAAIKSQTKAAEQAGDIPRGQSDLH